MVCFRLLVLNIIEELVFILIQVNIFFFWASIVLLFANLIRNEFFFKLWQLWDFLRCLYLLVILNNFIFFVRQNVLIILLLIFYIWFNSLLFLFLLYSHWVILIRLSLDILQKVLLIPVKHLMLEHLMNVILLFGFMEIIHIELAHEGREIVVFEILWKHFLTQLRLIDNNECVPFRRPRDHMFQVVLA